ncbi:phosphoribosylanthranilate isomerase [Clostridium intestinale]|uniref:N-(5'-phosphoribosyl)anthranilate isomerase n=1 Tax=Clostridium intestinale DSM 6191 TaxID=1121320 RepID=A0A1M5XWJ7_9CLOT|nr:phosphoribosylanthranilate isomerase [Clostridium intestinale]SHI04201.1 phosphoribosylanthranilate isomerase [Clostridium intestinale DSM 6191]
MTKIKICGIKDREIGKYVEELGADALGFILCPSKRRIDMDTLKAITLGLGNKVEKVGVFVNQSEDEIKKYYCEGGLSMVQLHGDEDENFIRKLPFKVIKAFNVGTLEDVEKALNCEVPFILLEGKGLLKGGNGNKLSSELLEFLGTVNKKDRERIILAGGLNSENILNAIEIAKPCMIDVSSSVEVDGVKNKQKIKEFIEIVRGHK